MKSKSESKPKSQRGAALIVSLILLIVLTLLGLSSVRTVAQEERMTANTYDRSLGFQGAEAALRAGEDAAVKDAEDPAFETDDDSCSCVNEVCSPPVEACLNRLDIVYACEEDDKSDCGPWVDAAGLDLGDLAETPQYFVEYLGGKFPCNISAPDTGATTGCKRYRVTARSGNGANNRSTVILQSIYATP